MHRCLIEDVAAAQHQQKEAAKQLSFLDQAANCISEVNAPTHVLPSFLLPTCTAILPAWLESCFLLQG